MRYYSLFILISFVISINAEIPDIKKLWKKYDYNSSSSTMSIQKQNNNSKSKLDSAAELVKNGDYSKALKIYEGLLNKNVRSSHIHTAIGYCFEKMGNIENAIAFYTKAIGLTPVDPNAYNNLAYLTADRAATPDEVFPSIKLIDTALKYAKGNLKYNQTKLFILKKASLMDDWEDIALEILKKNPNINSINIELGEYYIKKGDYVQARLFLNRALPEKRAQQILATIPSQNNQKKESQNENKVDIKNDFVNSDEKSPSDDNMSENFKEFQQDYLVQIADEVKNKEDEKQKEKNNDVIVPNPSSTSPDIVRLRVNYEDSFDTGLDAYNNGNYSKAMEYFEDFINISKKNKNFSEKLLRALKYKGLILTKEGNSSKDIWGEIDFVESCVFVDKARKLKQSSSLEALRKHLLSGLSNSNLSALREIISQSLAVLEGYKKEKEDIELFYDIDFKIPQNITEVFPSKTAEYFTQGYKSLIEKKYTECEKYFKLSVNNSPSYFPGYYNLSVLSVKNSKLVDALTYIERSERYCMYNEPFYKDIRKLYNALNLYML